MGLTGASISYGLWQLNETKATYVRTVIIYNICIWSTHTMEMRKFCKLYAPKDFVLWNYHGSIYNCLIVHPQSMV